MFLVPLKFEEFGFSPSKFCCLFLVPLILKCTTFGPSGGLVNAL